MRQLSEFSRTSVWVGVTSVSVFFFGIRDGFVMVYAMMRGFSDVCLGLCRGGVADVFFLLLDVLTRCVFLSLVVCVHGYFCEGVIDGSCISGMNCFLFVVETNGCWDVGYVLTVN